MLRQKLIQFLIAIIFLQVGAQAFSQSQPLFETDNLLELEITYSFKDFFKSRKERNKIPASIVEISTSGDSIKNDIKISMRGKSRTKICRYPPIRLHFKNSATEGVFINQNKLKLVTHCKDAYSFENYVKKEYLIYKLYNLISDVSIRARMCKITYKDSNNQGKSYSSFGIILEDIGMVATRNNLKSYKRDLRSQDVTKKGSLDKLVLFQYMIGNLDWEIGKQHNIKLLRGVDSGLPVAVPYDFDYAGFVDANYAVPPETMDLTDVKIRVFRGFCRIDYYAKTIDYYLKNKSKFYNKIQKASYLSDKERGKIKDYINDFYATLENKSKRMERIGKACRAKHKHVYQK